MIRALFFLVFLTAAARSFGQAVPDTSLSTVIPDTARDARLAEPPQVRVEGPVVTAPATPAAFQPIPKKAALFSAMLPGAGQIYNRQYWKAPIVYAGVATSIGFLVFNTNQYRQYRSDYLASLDPAGDYQGIYTTSQLQTLQDAYRRYLDLTVLFTALGYTIQVLDALVYAHLKNFDVSKDLSMRFQPVVLPGGGAGFGLVMNFR